MLMILISTELSILLKQWLALSGEDVWLANEKYCDFEFSYQQQKCQGDFCLDTSLISLLRLYGGEYQA